MRQAQERAVGWAMRQPGVAADMKLVLLTMALHVTDEGVVDLPLERVGELAGQTEEALAAITRRLGRQRLLLCCEQGLCLPAEAVATRH